MILGDNFSKIVEIQKLPKCELKADLEKLEKLKKPFEVELKKINLKYKKLRDSLAIDAEDGEYYRLKMF